MNRLDEGSTPKEKDTGKLDAELGEADVVEVGRGLANYNSAQILAVKGLNRFVFRLSMSNISLIVFLVPSYPNCWGMLTRNM